MANDIRIDFMVTGPRVPAVDRIVGGLTRDGLNADVPIPMDAVPVEDPTKNLRSVREQLGVENWGCSGMDPDVLVKTATSVGIHYISGPASRRRVEKFTKAADSIEAFVQEGTVEEELACVIHQDCDGFEPATSGIAILKFYTPWSPPSKWIESVINNFYDDGLRFHLSWVDLASIDDNGGAHCSGAFWSVAGPDAMKDSTFFVSGHCAARDDSARGAEVGDAVAQNADE